MEAIKRASKAYHLKAATEEKGDAAKELRRLVLALPASEVEALGGEGSDPAVSEGDQSSACHSG